MPLHSTGQVWFSSGHEMTAPKSVERSVYTCAPRTHGVSPRVHNVAIHGESAPQERPRLHHPPIHLPRKKEKQCGAIVAQAWDTDIAPAAVEWRDTRYRNRHGRSGPAHRPRGRHGNAMVTTGNTGSLTPYWTASRKPPSGSRLYPRGRAEPERYPERVAHLTHNGALASNSSPGLLAVSSTMSSSRDEWVASREILQAVSPRVSYPENPQTAKSETSARG